MHLHDVHYDADGHLQYPHRDQHGDEALLSTQLANAQAILLGAQPLGPTDPTDADLAAFGLDPAGFESLRWFELPSASLSSKENGLVDE